MSKVAIVGDPSGTGTFTISAPNGNTDRTLVLPDEAGTIITTAGVPASAMPAGSVIQVVSKDITQDWASRWSSTSSSYSATDYELTITPTSASSKILVSFDADGLAGGGSSYLMITVYRNGTDLAGSPYGMMTLQPSAGWNHVGLSFVDAPSTTLATTYKVYAKNFATASGASYIGFNSAAGSKENMVHMYLMEIAG